jgi:hypothetical protein
MMLAAKIRRPVIRGILSTCMGFLLLRFCRRIIYALSVDNYPYRTLSTLWVRKSEKKSKTQESSAQNASGG